jgi:hypothetical protein
MGLGLGVSSFVGRRERESANKKKGEEKLLQKIESIYDHSFTEW